MKNRTVALVLTFFLGYLGIHKFYLGHHVAGIVYLIFSWSFIPAIFAIFDFIGLALMSEQNFNALYNPQLVSNNQSPNQLLKEGLNQDKIRTLTELKKLYDKGIITAEEYEQKRRKYIDLI